MVWANIMLTLVGVGAFVLLTGDVKHSAATFRRNARQIRHWIEQEYASVSKGMENGKPKKPKEDKH